VATVEATVTDDLAGVGDVVDAVGVAGSDGVGAVKAFAAVAAARHHRHRRHSCVRRDGAAHGDDAARCLPRPHRRVAAAVVPITFGRADYVILQTKPIIIIINVILLYVQLKCIRYRVNHHNIKSIGSLNDDLVLPFIRLLTIL